MTKPKLRAVEGASVSIKTITPEIAAKMLSNNETNRPISARAVARYAAAMSSGEWMFNGESIVIGADGSLLDGQHRLSAVIKSGIKITAVVVDGINPEAYQTLDVGKMRSAGDALAVFDPSVRGYRSNIAAALKNVMGFDKDGYWHVVGKGGISNTEIIEAYKKHKRIVRSCEHTRQLRDAERFVPKSALAAMHYVTSKIDVNAADDFMQRLDTGERLGKTSPILKLRSTLADSRDKEAFRARTVMPYLLYAWELYRNNARVTGRKLILPSDYEPRLGK